jgi:hypothetical protein
MGAEQHDVLAVRASFARWTGVAGDPVAARDQFVELLPACERVVGTEHPDTLTVRADLARWTGEACDQSPLGTSSPSCCPSVNA